MSTLSDWRIAIRQHLGERLGQEVEAGELFDRFGALLPLQLATRTWHRDGRTIGTTPHDLLRWRVFSHHLRVLNVRFDPPFHPNLVWMERTTKVIPLGKTCVECGQVFFGYQRARCCGRACGSKQRWRNPAAV